MGDPVSWLIFLGVAALALALAGAAVVVLVLVAAGRAAGRGWTLGAAGIGAGVALAVCVASAAGLTWTPAGMHTSHLVFLSVPVVSAGFLLGAGVGFLTRRRSRPKVPPPTPAEAGAEKPSPADPRIPEWVGRLMAAHEKAWWKDLTGLVGETDQQLVVISPRSDATPDDLRALGQELARWKAEFRQARHIWGLTDLLQGQCPRTPPIYLSVPYSLECFEECYEPVALVYVAEGTNIEKAARALHTRLSAFHGTLAWFEHPDAYSYYQR